MIESNIKEVKLHIFWTYMDLGLTLPFFLILQQAKEGEIAPEEIKVVLLHTASCHTAI
jgi:hypothetical protein